MCTALSLENCEGGHVGQRKQRNNREAGKREARERGEKKKTENGRIIEKRRQRMANKTDRLDRWLGRLLTSVLVRTGQEDRSIESPPGQLRHKGGFAVAVYTASRLFPVSRDLNLFALEQASGIRRRNSTGFTPTSWRELGNERTATGAADTSRTSPGFAPQYWFPQSVTREYMSTGHTSLAACGC